MKIKSSQLKYLIKEEILRILNEQDAPPSLSSELTRSREQGEALRTQVADLFSDEAREQRASDREEANIARTRDLARFSGGTWRPRGEKETRSDYRQAMSTAARSRVDHPDYDEHRRNIPSIASLPTLGRTMRQAADDPETRARMTARQTALDVADRGQSFERPREIETTRVPSTTPSQTPTEVPQSSIGIQDPEPRGGIPRSSEPTYDPEAEQSLRSAVIADEVGSNQLTGRQPPERQAQTRRASRATVSVADMTPERQDAFRRMSADISSIGIPNLNLAQAARAGRLRRAIAGGWDPLTGEEGLYKWHQGQDTQYRGPYRPRPNTP